VQGHVSSLVAKLWAHPVSYPVGTKALSLGVKQQGHETDHSVTSSKNKK
jgi:hypothetical protein